MRCPKCKHRSVQKHGAQAKFPQPYQCTDCHHIFYPWVRQAGRWLVGVLLVVGLSPWWLNKTLQLIVTQPDTGESVDAIVVLGRGPDTTESRAAAAVELWEEGRAPQVFMSGVADADLLVNAAKEMGLPDAHLSSEGCSRSTWENAFYTELLFPFEDPSNPKILLVTDDLHIARSTVIYRNFGFEVIPYPVKLKPSAWRRHLFREFLVAAYYVYSRQLLPPGPENYKRATATAEMRINVWKCLEPRDRVDK